MSQPLNKRSLVCTVVARILIEAQCTVTFRACQKHHLVAICFDSQFFRIVQAGRSIAFAPVICVSNNVLNECIGAYIPCEVRNNYTNAGRNVPAVHVTDNDMMILITAN